MNSPTSTPPPSSSTTMNDDKLSGQLIIKAQLGDDIRKMMIHNEDLTLNELVLMMERIFTGKISNSDQLTIKYLDDDGDKITLLNDSDLTVALHFHKLLRLFVFINGAELIMSDPTNQPNKDGDFVDAKTFRNELQEIRNSVQIILDRIQSTSNEISSATTTTTVPPSTVTTREFDPYKQSQQNSATPDTIQSHANHVTHSEHQTAHAQQVESTDMNKVSQTQMPTPHFVPSGFHHEQQAMPNIFGPPPTAFPGMPPLPNSAIPRYPPATSPNRNGPPTMNPTSSPPASSAGQPSPFIGQQTPVPPAQSGGYYGQQQGSFQQRPPNASFNTFPPQQPATINPSFAPPPPMASQQPYGAYPPQNSYYNPVQQYPQT